MDDISQEEALKKLFTLSQRERQVLELRCQGLDYKSIGATLFVSVPAVKQYMSRVYVKLGLDLLSSSERTKAIYEIYCPLRRKAAELKKEPDKDIQAPESGLQENEQPETPIPDNVGSMIDEDEYPIVVYEKPKPIIIQHELPPIKPKRFGYLILLIGVVLGICFSLVIAFLLLRNTDIINFLIPQPTQPVPKSIPQPTDTSIPTPTIEIPTQTPAVVQQVVVVTATPQLATEVPTLVSTIEVPTPVINLPFEDDFDNGASPEWQSVTSQGTWRVINGKYTETGEEIFQWSYSFIGDSSWQDYIVDVDYSRLKDEVAGVAVIVRAGATNDLHLAFILYNYKASWKIWQDGQWQTIVTSDSAPNDNGHIKVVVAGSTFTASANGISPLVITDNSSPHGKVGLGVECRFADACPVFDNFSIK